MALHEKRDSLWHPADGVSLTNSHLIVELADTNSCGKPRFDRTGFITQVTLRNSGHTFCVYERTGSSLREGGAGLCGEFGIFSPIGYSDAAVGESFPKPGVGLLTRIDGGEYDFHRDYPLEPFHIKAAFGVDQATYQAEPKQCRGYAMALSKTVTLSGPSLSINYTLANAGEHPFETEEYVHNFIGIDRHPIGPDYKLRFSDALCPTLIEPNYTPQILRMNGADMEWNGIPAQPFYARFAGLPHEGTGWELIHLPSGAGMREECSFPVDRIALWGTTHAVSPEMFIRISLQSGESMSWCRKYTFFDREA
jgi:hypothetical protein